MVKQARTCENHEKPNKYNSKGNRMPKHNILTPCLRTTANMLDLTIGVPTKIAMVFSIPPLTERVRMVWYGMGAARLEGK